MLTFRSIMRRWHGVFHTEETNRGLRSEMMSGGVPWSFETWNSNNLAVSHAEFTSVVGMTWAILENLSTTMTIAFIALSS